MYIPTRKDIATWAGYALIGLSGAAIGATVATLTRTGASPPTPAKPLARYPEITVFPAGSKGHLYRVGLYDGAWEPYDNIAFVDELMAMRLKTAAPAWGAAGEGIEVRYPGEVPDLLYLSPAPHVAAPDQIGRLFMVRGKEEVLFLLSKCKDIVKGGAGVEMNLEAIA